MNELSPYADYILVLWIKSLDGLSRMMTAGVSVMGLGS